MTNLNVTVREFLKEFCDKACFRVEIFDVKKRVGYRFSGKQIDEISENLLMAKVKKHILCYEPEYYGHWIRLFVDSSEGSHSSYKCDFCHEKGLDT